MDSEDKLLATVVVSMFVGVMGSAFVGWPALVVAGVVLVIIHFPKKES